MPMIKNIYKIFRIISTSLILSLLALSCEGDNPSSSPQSLQIWDDWQSGSYSYYTNADCSGEAMSLDSYTNLMIDNQITSMADSILLAECNPANPDGIACDLNHWIDYIVNVDDTGLWTADKEQAVIDEIISTTGISATLINSISLLISVNMTFNVNYDGVCLNYSTGSLEESEYCTGNADVNYNNGYCEFETEFACLSASGTWDTGYQGSWDENDSNYLISWTTNAGEDNQETYTKKLLYSEDLISMIEYESDELCISLDFTRK